MVKIEYDIDDFGPAAWPVTFGALVYLFDRRGKYYGKPCVMMRCWKLTLSVDYPENKKRGHIRWRGCVQLEDGTEINADETEIMILRSPHDFLDPANAEPATLPLTPSQPVYVIHKSGSDDPALVRCSIIDQRLEKVNAVEGTSFGEDELDSEDGVESLKQGVWWVDIRVEAGTQGGRCKQVNNCDLYVQRVEI